MNNWYYEGEQITDISQIPDEAIGFIYKIVNGETGKFYVGKKNLYSTRNIKLGKKALAAREDKRLSKKKKIVKESDWKTYFGSEPVLKEEIENDGDKYFHRTILHFCNSKKSLTYQEIRYQILSGCLESQISYNSNISGKFFRSDAK